jgi:hypothetical protein
MRNLVLVFVAASTILFAQNKSLYVPLDIQNAIKKETRTENGEPGVNYWQNKSDYKIDAEIFPDSSLLVGEETIKYYNNSPDSLDRIVIRLYGDIFKKGATRDWYVNSKYLNNGETLQEFIINDKVVDISDTSNEIERGSTNMIVRLEERLAPYSFLTLKTKWQLKIPEELKLRMGNYGNGNFFVSYWYPQIAVYDDIDGWDMLDYQGTVEFYNDFNNYEVNLTIPSGYLAWATGELQNPEEVLRKDIYEKYQLAKSSDETIRIITQDDYKKGLVTADNEKNVWHFIAFNVTDVSFILSKSDNWDGASVEVEKTTGRRALTDVVYPDSSIYYNEAAQYARATIEYMSNDLPGYPYPYPHVTSFCNGNRYGGGMETPMMANDGAPRQRASHIGLIFHEIAHNYFPFIMGTNERKYAWMDEGWASFYPRDVLDKYELDYDYLNKRVKSYENDAGREAELPPMVVSYSNKGEYLRTAFYDRPAVAYNELMELLGRDLFKKAMLEYINRWHSKHPIPIDFFNTISNVAKEDLTWFWKPWFYEFGYPDLAVEKVENNDGNISAVIKKIGNVPTRVKVTFEFTDGTNEIVEKPASVWKDGNDEISITVKTSKNLKSVKVGDKHIPDSVKENDSYTL